MVIQTCKAIGGSHFIDFIMAFTEIHLDGNLGRDNFKKTLLILRKQPFFIPANHQGSHSFTRGIQKGDN